MFIDFLYELRARGLSVGAQEAVSLAEALSKGLHESSLEGFYHVARATMVHRETELDDFDLAFAKHFKGIEVEAKQLKDDLLDWLREAADLERATLTPEERALLDSISPEEIERMFRETQDEQTERHDGGNRWIGTKGKSPFGHSGAARQGIRVGGPGGGRSAFRSADARKYKGYRDDLTLDIRQLQVALRKLRAFTRLGLDEELDIEGTIDATAKNAGELDIVTRPPRRSNTRVVLMMDVGGSMDPYVLLCSRLFSAAKKSTHFRELHTYYFHNCVYGRVYKTDRFDDPVPVSEVFRNCGRDYKLIMVGDALMAPYELLASGGALPYEGEERVEGIVWLMRLMEHFKRSAWLNPEPEKYWHGNTIEYIRNVFPMFPFTLAGLGDCVKHLSKKG